MGRTPDVLDDNVVNSQANVQSAGDATWVVQSCCMQRVKYGILAF